MTNVATLFQARMRYAQRLLVLLLVLLTVGCTAPTGDRRGPAVLVPSTPSAIPTAPAPSSTPRPGTAIPVPTPIPRPPDAFASGFSGQRALDDVRWLAETIGSRPAGSDAERQAAEALADRLTQLGYDTMLQPFPMRHFEDRGSTLHLLEQSDLTLDVQALQNSGSGSVSGRLVDVGLGRSQDLNGRDLRGAIALIGRGEITFGEKVQNAAGMGAIGAIVYNNASGSFQGTLRDASSIPVVALDDAQGQQLVQLLRAEPLTAELSVDAAIVEATSQNMVATRSGSTEDTIVLGAHYDTVAAGPGANDNGSGTATVLELARSLSDVDMPYTIQIVLFGAEELGLIGSRHYVDSLPPLARERIVVMLNFDMVGVGEQSMVGGSPELVALARESAEQAGTQLAVLADQMNGRSDHASFLDAGIPAIFFYRSEDPRYHTAGDRAEHVDAANLEVAGRLATRLLNQIGAATPVP
jgi:aminopeptidase YwaD